MKKIVLIAVICLVVCGCGDFDKEWDRAFPKIIKYKKKKLVDPYAHLKKDNYTLINDGPEDFIFHTNDLESDKHYVISMFVSKREQIKGGLYRKFEIGFARGGVHYFGFYRKDMIANGQYRVTSNKNTQKLQIFLESISCKDKNGEIKIFKLLVCEKTFCGTGIEMEVNGKPAGMQ